MLKTQLSETKPSHAELRLREPRRLRGRVITERGDPIAGARIGAWPAGSPMPSIVGESTDADGYFPLRLPAGTREIELLCQLPTNRGGRLLRYAVPQERDLVVVVGDAEGTLNVELPAAYDPRDSDAPVVALFARGANLAVAAIQAMLGAVPSGSAPGAGPVVSLPAMGVGEYSLCFMSQQAYAANADVPLASIPCSSGSLWAGGDLRLKVPDLKSARGRGGE